MIPESTPFPILHEGKQYRLPDDTLMYCTKVVYGIKSPDHSVMVCEFAHTAKLEPCGYRLESPDEQMVLMVNADGSITQRDGQAWKKIPLRIEDIRPVSA